MESVISYSGRDLLLCLLTYAFLAWAVQVCWIALWNKRYVNQGMLSVPFDIPAGLTAMILMVALPTLDGNGIAQFILCWIVLWIVRGLSRQFVKYTSRTTGMERSQWGDGNRWMSLLANGLEAVCYLVIYLVVHPFVFGLVLWVPDWLAAAVDCLLVALVVLDYFAVVHTFRTSRVPNKARERGEMTQRIADRMSERMWRRLEKAYPGVKRIDEDNLDRYTFGKGICFDKLVWVFLISSFLGALIEMVYCYSIDKVWMNRSSVLYGAFSFVWGFGAVVLTVVLQRFAGKEDRKVFLAGFVVGGAYEYLCSVFTELVFGTVFWDYSEMPLNIGGRTNVLYCIFWGILAVVWIKVLYPPMDRLIEKIPPVIGKVITWIIVAAMLCNGVLTAGAMIRYTQRQDNPVPEGIVEEFLDSRYDDAWMESRWPNMKITEKNGET